MRRSRDGTDRRRRRHLVLRQRGRGLIAVYAARQLGDRVVGIIWVDVLRSLGDEPVSPPDVVEAFVAPFREDFPAAVDQFARSLFPTTADGALVDRIAEDMAAARQEATLGSIGYALNRHPPIIVDGVGHFLMLEAPARFNAALASTPASFE